MRQWKERLRQWNEHLDGSMEDELVVGHPGLYLEVLKHSHAGD